MANYATLKAAINAVITANGAQEITGEVLNQTLTAIVNSLGAGYQFMGIATPSTNPATPDQNVFYLAGQAGTYTNFNNITILGGVSVLKYNGSWTSETVMAGDGVFDISAYKAVGGTLTPFVDLAAALDSGNNVPVSIRKGGMSIKFIQSSDNKYVQFRYMLSTITSALFSNPDNWQNIDDIIYNSTNYDLSDFANGYYDLSHQYANTTLNESQTFRALKIPVLKDDVIEIRTYGGNDARAFALTNKNYLIYKVAAAQANYTSGLFLKVQQDGWAFVSVNTNSYATPVVIHQTFKYADYVQISENDTLGGYTLNIGENEYNIAKQEDKNINPMFVIDGNGNTLQTSANKLFVSPNSHIRLNILNPDVDMSGVSDGNYRLDVICVYNGSENSILSVARETPLKDYYDIIVPSSCDYILFRGRCTQGHTLNIGIESISLIDDVRQLHSDVNSCVCLEIGALNASTGEEASYDIRTRTKNYINAPFYIKTNTDYLVSGIFKYEIDVYGNISYNSFTEVNAAEYTKEKTDNEVYRVVFKKSNGNSFVTNELESIINTFNGSLEASINNLDEKIEDVKSNIITTTDYDISDFENGYYDLSHSVVYTTLIPSGNIRALKFKVKQGDIIYIKTYGGNDARAYALTDLSLSIYAVSAQQADYRSGLTLTATKDGWAYISVNTNNYATPTVIHYNNIIDTKINAINNKILTNYSYDIDDFNVGHYYDLSHEAVRTTLLDNVSLAVLKFRVSKGDTITIKLIGGYDGRAYALTDNNLNIYNVSSEAADYSSGIELTAIKDGWLYLTDNINSYANPTVAHISCNVAKNSNDLNLFSEKVGKQESELSISMFSTMGCCGSSSSAGALYHGSTLIGEIPEISWGKILGRNCGIDVSLYAYGGTSSRTWQTNPSCLPKLLSEPAKQLYIIQLGSNDLSDNIPLGTIADINEDYTDNPNSYYGNMGRIIDQIMIHAPHSKIILSKHFLPNLAGINYNWYSAAMEEISEHYSIPFIETRNSDYLTSQFATDNAVNNGGHATAIGYSGIAKAMRILIEKVMKSYYTYFEDYIPT